MDWYSLTQRRKNTLKEIQILLLQNSEVTNSPLFITILQMLRYIARCAKKER